MKHPACLIAATLLAVAAAITAGAFAALAAETHEHAIEEYDHE